MKRLCTTVETRERSEHMDVLVQEDGFTLIEILVALAILSVVTASVLLVLNGSLVVVYTSGHKSQALYEAQSTIEKQIVSNTGEHTTLHVAVPKLEQPLSLDGRMIHVEMQIRDTSRAVSLTVFVPEE
jgi:prepilin-type N-terminal cleavage/methylation domain-containing protein